MAQPKDAVKVVRWYDTEYGRVKIMAYIDREVYATGPRRVEDTMLSALDEFIQTRELEN